MLLLCRAPEVLISGPAGTGKTRALLEKLHLCATKYPGMRGLILRKTRESLTESALVTWEQKVVPQGHPCLAGPKRKLRDAYHYPNGSVVVVGGLRRSDSDQTQRIMSTEYDVAVAVEAIELGEGEWEQLTTRLRNGVMPYAQLLGDTNPDRPDHWLKRRCDAGRCVLLESRHEDNPTVTPEYLARLDALTGARLDRLRYGRWVKAEGVVYPGWDARVHLIDAFPIPKEWPRYWSLDFGFTNPFVCQFWALDPDGRLYLVREVYHTGRLVEDHARRVLQLCGAKRGDWSKAREPRPRAAVADHDAEGRETFERHTGVLTTPADKAVQAGIQDVAARLRVQPDGRPRLYVLRGALDERDAALAEAHRPCCTAEEWDGYVWDLRQNRKKGEVPLDRDDHGCLAAGTLVETDRGPRPIERVSAGELVLTRGGFRCVLASGMTNPTAFVRLVILSDGRALVGTPDHPVFVPGRGFTDIDSLRYLDRIEGCEANPLFGAASRSDATRTQSGGATACTSFRLPFTGRTAWGGSTKRYGNQFTAPSRTAGRFTTGTVIRSTTTLEIWSACLRKSMPPFTPHSSPKNSERSGGGGLPGSARLRLTGTVLRRAASGTGGRGSAAGWAGNSGPRNVSVAEWPIRPAPSTEARSIAPPGAAPMPAGSRGLTTKIGPACGAARCSLSTATRRRAAVPVRVLAVIALAEPMPVFNLTVEGCPEFYANGVLVHNCDALRYMVRHLDGRPRGVSPGKQPDEGRNVAETLKGAWLT